MVVLIAYSRSDAGEYQACQRRVGTPIIQGILSKLRELMKVAPEKVALRCPVGADLLGRGACKAVPQLLVVLMGQLSVDALGSIPTLQQRFRCPVLYVRLREETIPCVADRSRIVDVGSDAEETMLQLEQALQELGLVEKKLQLSEVPAAV